ncbi:hypothetical protein GTW56_18405 [Bacillus sp. EB93]|nr:hypothetical protein [Peribacillus frigoritolerans]
MKRINEWVQINKIKSVLIVLLTFYLLPLLIVHILYKIPTISTVFITKWSAGELIDYSVTFMAFLGTLALGGVAYIQNNRLNKINNDLIQHQYKPIITVSPSVDENNEREKLRTYYRTVERNESGILINHGWSESQTYFPIAKLSFLNIGLGPAVNVQLFWYQLDSVDGISKLDEISKINIDDFYEKVKYSNFTYIDNGITKNEPWQIFTDFSLGVNEDVNRLNLLLSFENNPSPFHSIIEIRYENLLGMKIKQLLYLGYDGEPNMLPVSNVKVNNSSV